ncbi:MAG: Lrp/AsnC ligand binding domain-containing protein [Thermoanaerobaculia bacterium]|nr:Lrp/AsnC ligand binding domain-containing protein [Thermoanaerobaculia bacterium]
MVTAIVLLNVERDRINEVAEALVELDQVSEVYSVAGQYDLVVLARAGSNEDLASLVTDRMLQLEGIHRSETLIAFKVYSRHDLERMFSVGFEKA